MDSIDILIDYFNIFKKCENDEKSLKNIDKYLKILDNSKNKEGKVEFLTDLDEIEKIVKNQEIEDKFIEYINEKYGNDIPNYVKDMHKKGVDNILYDVMFNIAKYNSYISNKKEKTPDIPIDTDIMFDNLSVDLKDILNYLEINIDEVDKNLLEDISKYADLKKFKEFAIAIKTDNGMRRVLLDKISDKNVLLSILLHSNLENVDTIIKIFETENTNLNKVVSNIPSIFIKSLTNSKCKYNDVVFNYDTFIGNYDLLKKHNIDFRKMLNRPVFFVNDINTNFYIIKGLGDTNIEELPKNVLENAGGIAVINPKLIFNDIGVLKEYNIPMTNDDNNNGYTLLGMKNLKEKLDYLIENNLWTKDNSKDIDLIDFLRGLIIKDDYIKARACKNNSKYDKIVNTSPDDGIKKIA